MDEIPTPNNSIVTVESIINDLPVTSEEFHDRRKMVRLLYRSMILLSSTALTFLLIYVAKSTE